MAKPVIRWKPRAQKDPQDETKMIYVPTIVDRQQVYDLTDIAYQAIDTGRIPGLKTSAAESIGRGLLEQIGVILQNGSGVKFGEFFRASFYLDGTVKSMDANLTAANALNVRIQSGTGLKLNRNDFTFRNVLETGDEPVIDDVFSDVAGAVSGQVKKNSPIVVYGSSLKMGAGDSAQITWFEDDGGETPTEHSLTVNPTLNSDVMLKFSWPEVLSELDAGTPITVKLTKYMDVGGVSTAFYAQGTAEIVAA